MLFSPRVGSDWVCTRGSKSSSIWTDDYVCIMFCIISGFQNGIMTYKFFHLNSFFSRFSVKFLWHWKYIIQAKQAKLLLFYSSKAAKYGSMWHNMVHTSLLDDFKCSSKNKIDYMTIFWPLGPEIDIFSSFDEYSESETYLRCPTLLEVLGEV